jgi:cytochrome c oxidase assembly protein subunit 11
MSTAPLVPDLPPQSATRHAPLIAKCLFAVGLSASLGFALVPLYDTLCRVVGLNGKTFQTGGLAGSDAAPPRVDLSRLVTVEFTGSVMPGLDWEIRPLAHALELHPGELHSATFLVHNRAGHPVTAQAVPSVTPGQAASHFEKIECFCFTQQTLLPGEAREMPVAFIVKPELGTEISTITLAYAFFPVPAGKAPARSATPATAPPGGGAILPAPGGRT